MKVCGHGVKALIGPSMLASDQSCLASESNRMFASGADYLHLDVMDGHFAPNINIGPAIIASLRKHTSGFLAVHLMVTNPEMWLDAMSDAGIDAFTFHVEVTSLGDDLAPFIRKIKEKGIQAGLAIKPKTDVSAVFPYLSILDRVLVMTVEPGFGGQKFMGDMMPKVAILREMCPELNIEVDGGLGPDNIDVAASAGANMIVAGSSVFRGVPANVISILRRSVEKFGNGISDECLSPLVLE